MRAALLTVAALVAAFSGASRAVAAIEYHFVPGFLGQPYGDIQLVDVVPQVGPSSFTVRVSGAMTGNAPSADPNSARAYLDKWGIGVLNPAVGTDRGIQGQVQMDGQRGGEYIRLEFAVPVRLTYLTFASVGTIDTFQLTADGVPVDLQSVFPGMTGIRSVSRAQVLWPGKIDFTRAAQQLGFAKTWDFSVAGGSPGDGIQLENVGCVPIPEPATISLWAVALAGIAAVMLRRRRTAHLYCRTPGTTNAT